MSRGRKWNLNARPANSSSLRASRRSAEWKSGGVCELLQDEEEEGGTPKTLKIKHKEDQVMPITQTWVS